MSWLYANRSPRRPSIRSSLSADSARSPSQRPEDAYPKCTLSPAPYDSDTLSVATTSPQVRRASSYNAQYGSNTAASSTTMLGSTNDIKRRQPYDGGDYSPQPEFVKDAPADGTPTMSKGFSKIQGSYKQRVSLLRRQSREIVEHVEPYEDRVNFILILAQALLTFGAPSHRIESQLESAANILKLSVSFIHLPGLIIANLMDRGTMVSETRFVRASGRIALTALHRVHLVYRDVLHDKVGVREGTDRLRKLLRARPIYPIWVRCIYAFTCASIICTTAFGGSLLDMFISGASAFVLQFLGLRVATKSAMYANVYEYVLIIHEISSSR
ncbi:hypothetical protein EIP86_010563 [Pleurotus ostreatoroseus]|nr:hypothetical protein EIP86_010563 [Pleurotus ostreatoroseus]